MVIQQTQGIWRTQDEKLKPYHAYLDLLVDRFDELRYIHLPKVEPAGMIVRSFFIETRSAPAYCCLIRDIEDQNELPWYQDIY